MQELYVDELRNRSITELDRILSQNETDSILRAKSRTAIRRELEAMEGEGKVSFMTDEEVALLHNFRRLDRKSTRLNSSHLKLSRMPSSA